MILVPALLVNLVIWPCISRLAPPGTLTFSSPGEEMDFAFNSLVGAWSALWLISPWLVRLRPWLTYLLALAFLLAAGMLPHAVAFGVGHVYRGYTAVMWYGACALGLFLGMTLTGISCRKVFSRRRFLLWLAPWTVLGASTGVALLLIQICSRMSYHDLQDRAPLLLLGVAAMCLSLGGFLYLVNLPFLILAFRTATYRDRMAAGSPSADFGNKGACNRREPGQHNITCAEVALRRRGSGPRSVEDGL